jgi:hypothetical protein
MDERWAGYLAVMRDGLLDYYWDKHSVVQMDVTMEH